MYVTTYHLHWPVPWAQPSSGDGMIVFILEGVGTQRVVREPETSPSPGS